MRKLNQSGKVLWGVLFAAVLTIMAAGLATSYAEITAPVRNPQAANGTQTPIVVDNLAGGSAPNAVTTPLSGVNSTLSAQATAEANPTPQQSRNAYILSQGWTDVSILVSAPGAAAAAYTVTAGNRFEGCIECRNSSGSSAAVTVQRSPSGGAAFTLSGFPATLSDAETLEKCTSASSAATILIGSVGAGVTCTIYGKEVFK